jgi:hypothetical protein
MDFKRSMMLTTYELYQAHLQIVNCFRLFKLCCQLTTADCQLAPDFYILLLYEFWKWDSGSPR